MEILNEALNFATEAHKGQVRKYTGEPYINHCIEVCEIIKSHGFDDINLLIAALLHDTVEDTYVTFQKIKNTFGIDVMFLVYYVTDLVARNQGNRKTRIELNTQHILNTTEPYSLLIKCADIISNTRSIKQRDPEFAEFYLEEKRVLLEAMRERHPYIINKKTWQEAYGIVKGD